MPKENFIVRNRITLQSSYGGLFRSSCPQPPFPKISPENTGGRSLLSVKLQTELFRVAIIY